MTEIPLQAKSKITLSRNILYQDINFDYYDPDGVYFNIKKVLDSKGYSIEIEDIISTMQKFLLEDRIYINEDEIFLKIIKAKIFFANLEVINKPTLSFSIKSTPFALNIGDNVVLLDGERQKSPYPIFIEWNFPGKIISFRSSGKTMQSGNILKLYVAKNCWIGGKEEFIFTIT